MLKYDLHAIGKLVVGGNRSVYLAATLAPSLTIPLEMFMPDSSVRRPTDVRSVTMTDSVYALIAPRACFPHLAAASPVPCLVWARLRGLQLASPVQTGHRPIVPRSCLVLRDPFGTPMYLILCDLALRRLSTTV